MQCVSTLRFPRKDPGLEVENLSLEIPLVPTSAKRDSDEGSKVF